MQHYLLAALLAVPEGHGLPHGVGRLLELGHLLLVVVVADHDDLILQRID